MRKTSIIFISIVCTSNFLQAQFIKEKAINAQIGLGISSPYNSVGEIADQGFFAQAELILKAASWIEFRPYVGVIFTNSNGKDLNDNPTDEKAESSGVLLGGKARVRAPIPYVSPFIELGIGASIGKFETMTFFDNIDKGGIIYHIPITLGLELGKNSSVDLALTYYLQPSVEQFVGAFALGIEIPLNKKSN
ncbi:MAG: hypothetical protein ACON5F_07745 [Jejuia sp.]